MYPHDTSGGGDGVMSGGFGDENRGGIKRPTTSATGGGAVLSTGAANYATAGSRPTTAASQNVLPPSSSSGARNWGFSNPTSAGGAGGRPGEGGVEPLFEQSNKVAATSAIATQQKRPHTAHVTGRSAGLSGDENEEVRFSVSTFL
jgi:hypothetical protein